MKYCLSSKVSKEYLQKANEIKLTYDVRTEDDILKFTELMPEITIVLEIPADKYQYTTADWDNFQKFNILCRANFKIAFWDIDKIKKAITKYNIKSFLYQPVHNFEQLHYLINAGACDVRICGELAHNLDLLDNFEITKRIYPNKSQLLEGIDPQVGSWIRPEDIENISQINICEFSESKKEREQALYRIYAEEHAWSGDLSLLVEDIKTHDIMNRMIPPEFQEQRSNCGWKCITKKINCHYCDNNLFLANPNLYKELINNEGSNSEG